MTLHKVRASDCAPAPWRNGGGRTRELLAWPAGPDWRLRISLADIDTDGPFSAFAGVTRWFAVIEGAGVVLSFADGERRLVVGSEPLPFDGAEAPGCRLVDGPTRDLNLMLRSGIDGRLLRALSGQPWGDEWPWRACYVAGAARWVGAGGQACDLEAGTLLAGLPPGASRLDAAVPGTSMFWLGAAASLP